MTRARLTAYRERGRWLARPRVAPGEDGRLSPLELCVPDDQAAAQQRADLIAELLEILRAAGHGRELLERAARNLARSSGAELADHVRILRGAAGGAFAGSTGGELVTVEAFAERWTSGQLAREFPDQVRARRHAKQDAGRIAKWILPVMGHLPLQAVRLHHLEELARTLNAAGLWPSTRLQMLLFAKRLLDLAVYPAKLIERSPFPSRDFLPKQRRRSIPYLRPAEDLQIMRCTDIPIEYRLLYGFLHRVGFRRDELLLLLWSCVDLDAALIRLPTHKTVDAMGEREIPLRAPEVRVLRWWRALNPDAVFVLPQGMRGRYLFRHLRLAGVTREELLTTTTTRRRLTLHGGRHAFITIAFAQGWTLDQIMSCTGHLEVKTLTRYRRAGQLAERFGDWTPLDQALPEVADSLAPRICPQVCQNPRGEAAWHVSR